MAKMECPVQLDLKDPNTYLVAADWYEENGAHYAASTCRNIHKLLVRMVELNLKEGDWVEYRLNYIGPVNVGKITELSTTGGYIKGQFVSARGIIGVKKYPPRGSTWLNLMRDI